MPSSLVSVPAAARSASSAGSVSRTTSRARWNALALKPVSCARSRQWTTRSRAASGVIPPRVPALTSRSSRPWRRRTQRSSVPKTSESTTMPMARMTIIMAISPACRSPMRYCCSRKPTENTPSVTSSSPAIRLRQANAHPCLSPPTNDGSDAGSTTWRNGSRPRRAHHLPGPQQDRRHVVDAGDQPVGDRRRGAEHDDERDRPLGQLEQQDRQREPGDRRHRLQPGDQRPDRRAGDLRRGDDAADERRR